MKSNTKENGYWRVLYAPTNGTMFRCERRLYACASLENLWAGVNRTPVGRVGCGNIPYKPNRDGRNECSICRT